nr:hypothetical protein [Klebsiella variicola]
MASTQARAEAVLKPALTAEDLPVSCSAFWRSGRPGYQLQQSPAVY